MRAILTILWDSYKLLNARKLFWISLSISVFLAVTYASISITPERTSVFFGVWGFDHPPEIPLTAEMANSLYLEIFARFLVPFWLGGLALFLGLISVCSVYPELMKAGSVDVMVSKPVSRVTLFLTKYVGNLAFVGIQVLLFSTIVFFAVGVRTGQWVPGIFSAVLLIIFAFSLVYCVAVLISMWTRSTLLSLLIATIFWGLTWLVQVSEATLYQSQSIMNEADQVTQVESSESLKKTLTSVYDWVKALNAPLPKSREVTYLVRRMIVIDGKDLTQPRDQNSLNYMDREKLQEQTEYYNRNSVFYILGTSALFEFVILGLACFSFARKDF